MDDVVQRVQRIAARKEARGMYRLIERGVDTVDGVRRSINLSDREKEILSQITSVVGCATLSRDLFFRRAVGREFEKLVLVAEMKGQIRGSNGKIQGGGGARRRHVSRGEKRLRLLSRRRRADA